MMLPLEAIEFSVLAQHNPREFDEEHALMLARSMNEVGIKTPFVVFPTEVMTEAGLIFEGFTTESAYVAATGWHRQWGLRLTEAEMAVHEITPDTLPLSEVPCEVRRGPFSEFREKLFTDNTQFVPGINPDMGKMPTREALRRIFAGLCLLPNYLEMSTSALAGIFKMAQGTANAWREDVIKGILDEATNPYQLTSAHRETLRAVIESGERVGLDGKRRKARQEKRASADTSVATEPESEGLDAETEAVRAATFAALTTVKTAFETHRLSTQMEFEAFCDECAHQYVQHPNVLQALLADSAAPTAAVSEATALARDLSVSALEAWQHIFSAIHTALETDATWVKALCVNPLDAPVADVKAGYARLTKQVAQAVHRWHPSLPAPEHLPLVETLIVDIGCQSVVVAMDDADARAAMGETAVSQFQEGANILRTYGDCFQSDEQVIQRPAADVLRQTILKAQRKVDVLKRFAVTEFSALGTEMQNRLQQPDPSPTLSIEERLYTLSQWQLGVDAACTIERAARVKTYQVAFDGFASAYQLTSQCRRRFIEAFTPSISDAPEHARPIPTFDKILQACQAMRDVSFSERIPKETDDPGFYPKLEKTAKVFEFLTEIATEDDERARDTAFIVTPVLDISSFQSALEKLANEEGLLQELAETFKPGNRRFNRAEFTSGSVTVHRWQQKYLLTLGEIEEALDEFYYEVIEPREAHAEALTAHEAAYDAARDTALRSIGEFPGEVTWRDVLDTAGEHIDSALTGDMPRSPEGESVDTRTVRHRTHLLHQLKKGVETGTSWFQHLLKSKAPAREPAPAPDSQPHYADPSAAHSLSFEELCVAVEEELGILVNTYPAELAEFGISVEQVEGLQDVLSEVTATL